MAMAMPTTLFVVSASLYRGSAVDKATFLPFGDSEGKRLFVYDANFDRSFKENFLGGLLRRTVEVERIDLTLRFYQGPPRKNEICFTGPFTTGKTIRTHSAR